MGKVKSKPKTPPPAKPGAVSSVAKPAEASSVLATDNYGGVSPTGTTNLAPGAPEVASDGILSSFPLGDLGQIKTFGRWATGFRLDGGAVRLLWLTARRVNDSANKQGFEITFFAEGAALARFRKRMLEKGAVKLSNFPYYKGDPHPTAAEDEATMLRSGESWTPSSTDALLLDVEGKYTVHFVDSKPEALRGAMRIRTYGGDEASTKSLQEVINRLGLHAVFAPCKPEAIERLKLARLIWSTDPHRIDALRFSHPYELSEVVLDAALEAAGIGPEHADRKAILNMALDKDPLQTRLRQMDLLLSKSSRAFLEWAKADSNSKQGIVPSGSGSDYAILAALQKQGIQKDAPELKTHAGPDPASARQLLLFGLLIKKAFPVAEELLSVDLEQVKIADLREMAQKVGIDTDGARLKGLRFEEVYPGYFTVMDPSRPEELKKAGARYLYSTADNPERVFSMLTGGQKSSLTRFQEGLLIQGKSSDADFNTGGAFSVFSRLVTESVISQAKRVAKGKATDSSLPTAFNSWGNSRPYKLIINRNVLARLDWYGYNGDNFGRTSGLSADNHGSRLIATINEKYSQSNELMFAVGNHPRFVDYVVCETQAQKDDLIKYLKDHGISEWKGRALEVFVRVETKLFEHPDDCTFEQAVLDSIDFLDIKDTLDAAKKKLEEQAKEGAQKAAESKADALVAEVADEVVIETIKGQLSWQGTQAVAPTAKKFIDELAQKEFVDAAVEAGDQSAQAILDGADLETQKKQSHWELDNLVRAAFQKLLKAKTPVSAKAQFDAETAAAGAKAATYAAASTGTKKADLAIAVKNAVRPAALQAAKAVLLELLVQADSQPFQEKGKSLIDTTFRSNFNYTLEQAARTAATQRLLDLAEEKGWTASMIQQAAEVAKEPLQKLAKDALGSGLSYALAQKVRESAKAAAQATTEVLVDVVVAEVKVELDPAARSAAKAAASAFNQENPGKAEVLSPEREAELVVAGLELLAKQVKKTADAALLTLCNSQAGQSADASAAAEAKKDHPAAVEKAIFESVTAGVAQTSSQHLWQRSQEAVQKSSAELLSKFADQIVPELVAPVIAFAVERIAAELAESRASEIADDIAGKEEKKVLKTG